MPYRISTHADAGDIIDQLVELGRAAFAQYEGAPSMDAEAKRWFLSRPGCEPGRCLVALDGSAVVANVIVTVQDVRLGGELLRCGIVDGVATHPAHQRKGLARELMTRAHEAMVADALDAALLYTNPDGHAYRFYEKLGYVTRARLALLVGDRPGSAPPPGMREMRPDDAPEIRDLVNSAHAGHDGFAPTDDALWRWHRIDRPANRPAHTRVIADGGRISATAAFGDMEILLDAERKRLSVAFDLAGPDAIELLGAAPTSDVALLLDERAPEVQRCLDMGLQRRVGEAAMVLPFTDRARAALERPPRPWYVMVESVVGV
ncbi:MAG: GNAT family N-acetyltransferase [Armatimonadota bacterium]|jgi:GNAT superfamily N-acetyltransferase